MTCTPCSGTGIRIGIHDCIMTCWLCDGSGQEIPDESEFFEDIDPIEYDEFNLAMYGGA